MKIKHGDNKVFKFLLDKKDLRYFNKNHFEFLAYLVEIPIEDNNNLQLSFSHFDNKGFIIGNNPILKAMKKERKQIIKTISVHNCLMVVEAEKLFEMPKFGVVSTIKKSNENTP